MIYIVGGISGIRACEDIDIHDVSTGLKGKFYMRVARRKCCAAATIAIQSCQHNAGDADGFMEGFGDVHRVLPRQRIGNE